MLTQKEGDSILRNGGDREEEDNSWTVCRKEEMERFQKDTQSQGQG
jgi:hypothetical protein